MNDTPVSKIILNFLQFACHSTWFLHIINILMAGRMIKREKTSYGGPWGGWVTETQDLQIEGNLMC